MLEEYLIGHCSPTLASLKTANLFTMPYVSEDELHAQVAYWDEQLSEKGLSVLLMRTHQKRALIYVCRRARLQENLRMPGVAQFLAGFGYEGTDAGEALAHLKKRLECSGDFPHEIGLFLDYPLDDVIGFIENAGQNYKCSGCWKVYSNEREAVRLFARYKKCQEVYLRLWKRGQRSILQLTVAAGAPAGPARDPVSAH